MSDDGGEKKDVGRPPVPPEYKRDTRRTIGMTEAEFEKFTKFARDNGFNGLADLMRTATSDFIKRHSKG